MTLSEARGLSEHELAAIGRLEQRVLDHDGGRLKLEWGILRHRSGDHVEDLLWWDGDQLLGFSGIYAFGGPVEITGMVDPEVRRRGIGTALLDRALVHSAGRGATEVLLVVPRSGSPGPAFATARGGLLEHSEHFLVLGGTPSGEPRQRDVILRPATATDGPAMKRVLAAAFGTRAGDDLGADPSDRQMVIERAGTVIGTVRVSGEHGRAGIYGFAVDPPFQGRGIGRDVLGRVCVMLRNEGNAEVVLEVAVDNDRAVELYTSVGFEPRATEDYYSLALR